MLAAVQELCHDVGVIVAGEETRLPPGGFGDAGQHRRPAKNVRAPVLSEDEHFGRAVWLRGETLEPCRVVFRDGPLVVVVLELRHVALDVGHPLLPRQAAGEPFRGDDAFLLLGHDLPPVPALASFQRASFVSISAVLRSMPRSPVIASIALNRRAKLRQAERSASSASMSSRRARLASAKTTSPSSSRCSSGVEAKRSSPSCSSR